MDCYDGEDMEPIVYHGKTLTRPITFREAISAIATQAFNASPYDYFDLMKALFRFELLIGIHFF